MAARDDVPHVESTPGQARQVTAIVECEVVRIRDMVGRPGVLLVLRIAGRAVFLLARFLPF